MKDIGIQNLVQGPLDLGTAASREKATPSSSFQEFLQSAIHDVDRLQQEAGHAAEVLAVGEAENIHETMIALQKAEISFKMMMQIRNKIVKAYEEVMRMQV